MRMLLIVSGDVEVNPGPFSQEQVHRMLEVMEMLPSIKMTQEALLTEVTAIKQKQITAEEKLTSLSATLDSLKNDVASLKTLETEVKKMQATTAALTEQFEQLATSHDDLENRSRRNNLIFYGVAEGTSETWEASEAKVAQVCDKLLGFKLEGSHVKRAHRLGRLHTGKCRPIIVNFSSFKTKQGILSQAFKFKDSGMAVGEDFSDNVRHERRKLLEFAKSQNTKYQLRFNRLVIGQKTYYVDPTDMCVKEKTV